MFDKIFLFRDNKNTEPLCIRVGSGDLYRADTGYGFVTERNRREDERLRYPELNAAFDTLYWYRNEDMTRIGEDASGCYVDSDGILAEYAGKMGQEEAERVNAGEKRRIPLCFKCRVPQQGNYLVTVHADAGEAMGKTLVFEGRRKLVFAGEVPAGEELHLTFRVNVCDIIPRGQTEVFEDRTVDITVVADRPRVTGISVQETECPTLYIAGDSTVTDQSAEYPYAAGTSYAGWGQMLPAYLHGTIAVSNHSHSGLTTDSFRSEGHYAIVEREGRPGDFILFQFGHNDQKLAELKAGEGYRDNLCRYIRESREKGMYPLLVTPLARNSWKGNGGCYNDLLEEYAKVCMEVGEETDTPVLDLHGYSMEWIKELGLEAVKPYFYPGDFTHTNDYGAYRMAGMVVHGMRKVLLRTDRTGGWRMLAELAAKAQDMPVWEPECDIVLPVKPECFGDVENPDGEEDPFAGFDRLSEPASRADALAMIIQALHYFPVNVYNDMFRDVVGHEWYAGTVECAWQNGMIAGGLVEDGCFYPERAVSLEEFLVLAVGAYQGRRKLPEERACVYDGVCCDFARPYVRAAYSLGLAGNDGNARLDGILTRGEAVQICRKMKLQ